MFYRKLIPGVINMLYLFSAMNLWNEYTEGNYPWSLHLHGSSVGLSWAVGSACWGRGLGGSNAAAFIRSVIKQVYIIKHQADRLLINDGGCDTEWCWMIGIYVLLVQDDKWRSTISTKGSNFTVTLSPSSMYNCSIL